MAAWVFDGCSLAEGVPLLDLLHGRGEGGVPVGEGLASGEHVRTQDHLADQLVCNNNNNGSSFK